jgi:hypothetical protein
MTDNDKGWKWYSGQSDEYFSDEHETREAAIAALDGERGYICEARQDPLRLADFLPDADGVLAQFDDNADDQKGEDGDPIFGASDEQKADLLARLKIACDDWQDAHSLVFVPWVFSQVRNQEEIEPTAPAGEAASHE